MLVNNSKSIFHPLFSGADSRGSANNSSPLRGSRLLGSARETPGESEVAGRGRQSLTLPAPLLFLTALAQQCHFILVSRSWFHFPAFFYPPKTTSAYPQHQHQLAVSPSQKSQIFGEAQRYPLLKSLGPWSVRPLSKLQSSECLPFAFIHSALNV